MGLPPAGAPARRVAPTCEVPSRGGTRLWHEVARGFAVLMGDSLVEAGIAPGVDDSDKSGAGAPYGEVDVSAIVTVLMRELEQPFQTLTPVPGWSVTLAATTWERRYSRWGVHSVSREEESG